MTQKHRKMEPIEVYTGYRRSRHRRMVLLRVKSGSHHRSILAIGEITLRRDSVLNSTKMETNMRVCGHKTNAMVKVLTGKLRVRS